MNCRCGLWIWQRKKKRVFKGRETREARNKRERCKNRQFYLCCWPLVSLLLQGDDMIDKELLAILACPACQGDVSLKDEKIVCVSFGRKYSIKNGVTVMLV